MTVCRSLLARAAALGIAAALLLTIAASAPAAVPPPPGGPILVVTSGADGFGRYLPEILRSEGLNEFDVADVGSLSPVLAGHGVVVLGPTRAQRRPGGDADGMGAGRRRPRRNAPAEEPRPTARSRRHRRNGERRIDPRCRREWCDRPACNSTARPTFTRSTARAPWRPARRRAAQRPPGGEPAQRRRRRRAGRGLHVRPGAIGRLHAPGQSGVDRGGARPQPARRDPPLGRSVLPRLGRPHPRAGAVGRRAAATAGQPHHRHGAGPDAAAAVLVPAAGAQGGGRHDRRRPRPPSAQPAEGSSSPATATSTAHRGARWTIGSACDRRATSFPRRTWPTPRWRAIRPPASRSRCTCGVRARPAVSRTRAISHATTS